MLQFGVRGFMEDKWLQDSGGPAHSTMTVDNTVNKCWQWFSNMSCTTLQATTQSWIYHTGQLLMGISKECCCTTLVQQCEDAHNRGTGSHHQCQRCFSTSSCVWNIMLHMQMHLRYSTSHHMVKYGYSDFLATL
jgi:hypothetical protein